MPPLRGTPDFYLHDDDEANRVVLSPDGRLCQRLGQAVYDAFVARGNRIEWHESRDRLKATCAAMRDGAEDSGVDALPANLLAETRAIEEDDREHFWHEVASYALDKMERDRVNMVQAAFDGVAEAVPWPSIERRHGQGYMRDEEMEALDRLEADDEVRGLGVKIFEAFKREVDTKSKVSAAEEGIYDTAMNIMAFHAARREACHGARWSMLRIVRRVREEMGETSAVPGAKWRAAEKYAVHLAEAHGEAIGEQFERAVRRR